MRSADKARPANNRDDTQYIFVLPYDAPMSESLDAQKSLEKFGDDFARVKDEVLKVIVGQTHVVDSVLIALFAGGHVLLEGVPGLGKTLLIRTLSQALQLKFGRIQFTPDLMPADVTGTTIVVEGEHGSDFQFRKGPIFAQILLADEINRATPKTQSSLLEAMQERSVTVGGVTHVLEPPFLVMATQNPIEQEGTYPLPEAQLDRFFFKLLVGYSTRAELTTILERTTTGKSASVQALLDAQQIMAYQKLVRKVSVDAAVQDYAVRLTLATHPKSEFATPMVNQFVRFGASPRAAQALILAGKVKALLAGRMHMVFDDIKPALLPAMRHRMLLNFEAEAEGQTADGILENLLETTLADIRLETQTVESKK